jgi:hypothetical protein
MLMAFLTRLKWQLERTTKVDGTNRKEKNHGSEKPSGDEERKE